MIFLKLYIYLIENLSIPLILFFRVPSFVLFIGIKRLSSFSILISGVLPNPWYENPYPVFFPRQFAMVVICDFPSFSLFFYPAQTSLLVMFSFSLAPAISQLFSLT